MTADVVSWLATTLDEIEREALAAKPGPWAFDADLVVEVYSIHHDGRNDYVGDLVCQARQDGSAVHIAAWDPVAVLASVNADRELVALHEQVPGEHRYRGRPAANPADPRGCVVCDEHDGIIIAGGPCRTVLLVASRYRHRPGYRAEEWKP